MDVELIGLGLLGPFTVEAIRFFARRFNAWQAEKQTSSAAFEEALASDDLKTLGKYFDEKFGSVKLSTYTSDSEIRNRINTYLKRVESFVEATPEEIASVAANEVGSPASESLRHKFPPIKVVSEDNSVLKLATESIRSGDSWSGLARVRRDLEKMLRQRAPDAGNMPLVRLAQLVEMPPQVMRSFKEFSSIANAAVHGSDVEPIEALIALNDAREVYHFLESKEVAR